MKPLVSVVMPARNTARYLGEAVDSVLAQTMRDWELLLVDDASEDGTEAVLERYRGEERIRILRNPEPLGAAESRNRALREAGGRYAAFLDSDDLWLPEKLARQTAFMERTGCAFSYTRYAEMDAQGRRTGVTVSGPERITRAGMLLYCWPGCLTVMLDLDRVGLLQIPDLRKNNDYALWLLASRRADCFLLDEELALYRRGRTGSISACRLPTLIGWHYRLFREAEGMGPARAAFHTGGNLVFGAAKKLLYVRRERL